MTNGNRWRESENACKDVYLMMNNNRFERKRIHIGKDCRTGLKNTQCWNIILKLKQIYSTTTMEMFVIEFCFDANENVSLYSGFILFRVFSFDAWGMKRKRSLKLTQWIFLYVSIQSFSNSKKPESSAENDEIRIFRLQNVFWLHSAPPLGTNRKCFLSSLRLDSITKHKYQQFELKRKNARCIVRYGKKDEANCEWGREKDREAKMCLGA